MQITVQFVDKVKEALASGPLQPTEMRRVEGLGQLYVGFQGLTMPGYEWVMECTVESQPLCLYRKVS